MNKYNKYVGIPYLKYGRDINGSDCWGLLRLVKKAEDDIELPMLVNVDSYDENSESVVYDICTDGWTPVELPCEGDVVEFLINGTRHHVGLVVAPGFFLHVRVGGSSTIESLSSPVWRHRITGYWRYTGELAQTCVIAKPHPLKTRMITARFEPGLSIHDLMLKTQEMASVSKDIDIEAVVYVNGEYIPKDLWSVTIPKNGSIVEYRAIPGDGDVGRLVGTLAIAALSFYVPGALGLAGTLQGALLSAGISMIGGFLLNAIFPIRPPKINDPNDPGQSKSMYMVSGSANQVNKYGAVPIVLGRFRFAPPLAAQSYESTIGVVSYWHMALAVSIGETTMSNLRFGSTPVDTFEESETVILDGSDSDDEVAAFNRIYGKDVSQEAVNVKLSCNKHVVTSATRTGGNVIINTSTDHEAAVGNFVKLYTSYVATEDASYDAIDENGQLYKPTVSVTKFVVSASGLVVEVTDHDTIVIAHDGPDGAIISPEYVLISTYIERVVSDTCDRVQVALSFPEGLRSVIMEGKYAGEVGAALFRGQVQVRQLNPTTLEPLTDWGSIRKRFYTKKFVLPKAWYNIDTDSELEPVYRWTIVSISATNVIQVRHGAFTQSKDSEPSGTLLSRLQAEDFGIGTEYARIPTIADGDEEMWRICVYGNEIVDLIDKRGTGTSGVTGGMATVAGLNLEIANGYLTRAQSEDIKLGGSGEKYNKRKDAFVHVVTFDVPSGKYEVRVSRTIDASKEGQYPSGNKYVKYHDCYIHTITGFENRRPITFKKPLSKVAVKIKATDQINGNLDGLMLTATSVCLDYDVELNEWVKRPTRNPASLYRYALQHPGIAKPLPNSKIDLDNLIDFHNWCRINEFTFDTVLMDQVSLEDLIRDICAAGRASPIWRDGKRSVVIEKPRTLRSQTFTPLNSWNFQGSRSMLNIPHGWRISFNNASTGYKEDELIVYSDGYSAANATLFEGISFPGVCVTKSIFRHARFHFAQLRLRPEKYTLETDWEGLACTRGDLVAVQSYTTLWGTGSARSKTPDVGIDNQILLDNAILIDPTKSYEVLIRKDNGSYTTRLLDTFDFTTPTETNELYTLDALTSSEKVSGNLIVVGEVGKSYNDCIIETIEMLDNECCKLTLVDYAPDVYSSDLETLPEFISNMTLPIDGLSDVILTKPVYIGAVSDESAMVRVSPGVYEYGLVVKFTNGPGLSKRIDRVEVQIKVADNTSTIWDTTKRTLKEHKSIKFNDVLEGETYAIRLRYRDMDGRYGLWSPTYTHTVVGRTRNPSAPKNVTITPAGDHWILSMDAPAEIDVSWVEVRKTNIDFGVDNSDRIYAGSSTAIPITPVETGGYVFYAAFMDDTGHWSTPTEVITTYLSPNQVGAVTQDITKISSGKATVMFDWSDSGVKRTFDIAGYEIRSVDSGFGTTGYLYKGLTSGFTKTDISNTSTTTMYLRAFDALGNYSETSRVITHDVVRPGNISSVTLTRVKSTLYADANGFTKPTDFSHFEFRFGQYRVGATAGDDTPDAVQSTADIWNDPDCFVVKSLTDKAAVPITKFPTPRVSTAGVKYRVAVKMFDKSDNESSVAASANLIVKSLT